MSRLARRSTSSSLFLIVPLTLTTLTTHRTGASPLDAAGKVSMNVRLAHTRRKCARGTRRMIVLVLGLK
jgi:hypothetical protein